MRLPLFASALIFATACDDSAGPSEPLEAATVNAGSNLRFSPGAVEIVAGGKVTWVFGGIAHTVTFPAVQGAPESIGLTASAQVERTFNTPGTYNYSCLVHTNPPMTGTVVVR